MFRKRSKTQCAADAPTLITASPVPTKAPSLPSPSSTFSSPLGMTFDFEIPLPPKPPRSFNEGLVRPNTSDGVRRSSRTLQIPTPQGPPRTSSRPESFRSAISRLSRDLDGFNQFSTTLDRDDVSKLSRETTTKSHSSFDPRIDRQSLNFSRPSTAGGLSSTSSLPRMEPTLFPKVEPITTPIPDLTTPSRSFVDSRDKPYSAPQPPKPPTIRNNKSVPNLTAHAAAASKSEAKAKPALIVATKPGKAAKSKASANDKAVSSLTVGTPYGATSSAFPLPQHVSTRPKTANGSSELAGVPVLTHHTSTPRSPDTRQDERKQASKNSDRSQEAKPDKQADAKPAEGKRARRMTRVFNPIAFLQRKKADVDHDSASDTHSDRGTQSRTSLRSREVTTAIGGVLPPEADPRIKGKGVHDFSAPRKLSTLTDYSPASPSQFFPSPNKDGSSPGDAFHNEGYGMDGTQIRINHTPVFTEHLGEVPDSSRRVSSLAAEELENKDFLARASKQSLLMTPPQTSGVLPPFARRSQILDPMQASLYRDTDDSDAQDGKEPDSATSSYSEVSPIIGTLDTGMLDMTTALSPVSLDDRFQPFATFKQDIPRSSANQDVHTTSGVPPSAPLTDSPTTANVSPMPAESAQSAFDSFPEPAASKSAQLPPTASANLSSLSLGSDNSSDYSAEDEGLATKTVPEAGKPRGKSGRKSFKFVDKLVSAVSSSKKADTTPKYSASNASRFSFQFGDGAAEEKALEEKHRKAAAGRDVKPAAARDGSDDDDYDDDYFDEDAMDDLDEMEVAAQQGESPYGSLLPVPTVPQNHLAALPPNPREDDTAGALEKAQSLRYLQKARQVLRDDDSLYEDDDVLGEEREVTYADHPAFRTHSAMANNRRGSETGPHSRQSSIQTSVGDAGDGYWRGGTIDDYMRDYAISSSGSVHSNAPNKHRKGSASSHGADLTPMPEGLPESPLVPSSELLPRSHNELNSPSHADASKIDVTPRPSVIKSRTISEMSFSTISDGTHHDSPNAQGLSNLGQAQNLSMQSPPSTYAESEGSSNTRSHGGSTLHNSMSSGQSLATSVDSSPAENKTLLKSLEARSASPLGAQGRSQHEKYSARETSNLVVGLGQRRTTNTASPAALKLTGSSQGLLSVPSSPAPTGRKAVPNDPRSNSALSANGSTDSRGLSIIEVADGDESDDEMIPSHSPHKRSDTKLSNGQYMQNPPPPTNDYLYPSPTIHSFPNSPTVAYSQDSIRSGSAGSSLMTASIFGRDSLDDSRDDINQLHQHLGAPTVETIYEVNTPDMNSANIPQFSSIEKPLQSPVSVKAGSLTSRRLTSDSQVLPDYAKWLQLDETKRSPTTARHVTSPGAGFGAMRSFHQSQDIADMQDDMYFDDGRFEQDMMEAHAGDIVDEDSFDDDNFLSRPNAAYLQTRETKGLAGASVAHNNEALQSGGVSDAAASAAVPFVAPEHQTVTLQRQASLQQYHAALADAATQAAADGRFSRATSVSTTVRSVSNPMGDGLDAHSSQQPVPSLVLATGVVPNFAAPGSNILNRQSQLLNASPKAAFDFGFDQINFGVDETMDEDDDLVAAANAEALANDEEGFYGHEFQFYGRPRSNSQENEVDFVNGGYFGADGDDGITRQKSLKEPNLTPITERSEFSTRNSFINMSQMGPASAGGYGSYSPAMTLSRMPTSPLVPDEVASFEQLRTLRARAFGSSGEGGGSPISNRSSSTSINGSFTPSAAAAASTAPARPTSHLANSVVPLNLNTNPSEAAFPAGHPPVLTTHQATAGAQTLFDGFNFHDSPTSPTTTIGDYPFTTDPDATPKKRSSSSAHSFNLHHQGYTTAAVVGKPFYASPVTASTGFPADVATSTAMNKAHSRNAHGGSADSITYTRGPDPEDTSRSRWFVERRRTSEASGQLELVAKDLVQGGWI